MTTTNGKATSAVLLFRLTGPMQSWGVQSRFMQRDTGLEPSKSGVVGLLGAALGRPRSDDFSDLTALRMAVRVDREGRVSRDYQTAGGERRVGSMLGQDAAGKPRPYGVPVADGSNRRTVVSDRFFLADADFLVGMLGPRELLDRLDAALREPKWPLFLGRKSFVPGVPPAVGVFDGDLLQVLAEQEPWRSRRRWETRPERLRLVVETTFGEGPEVRQDVPLSFAERQFTMRHVETSFLPDRTRGLELPRQEDDPWTR